MNTKKLTPPQKQVRKALLSYNENSLINALDQLKPEYLDQLQIKVLAEQDNSGHLKDVLTSDLSGENFDALASKAIYMLFEGPNWILEKLGLDLLGARA